MRVGRAASIISRDEGEQERGLGKKKPIFAALHKSWDLCKKPSITAGKGLIWVERSKGWTMLEGLSDPKGQICSDPEWDETSVSQRCSRPECDWCFLSVAIDSLPTSKRLSANSSAVTPQSFILSDSSLVHIKSFNPCSLFCLAYVKVTKLCHGTFLVHACYLVNISHHVVEWNKCFLEQWPFCGHYLLWILILAWT